MSYLGRSALVHAHRDLQRAFDRFARPHALRVRTEENTQHERFTGILDRLASAKPGGPLFRECRVGSPPRLFAQDTSEPEPYDYPILEAVLLYIEDACTELANPTWSIGEIREYRHQVDKAQEESSLVIKTDPYYRGFIEEIEQGRQDLDSCLPNLEHRMLDIDALWAASGGNIQWFCEARQKDEQLDDISYAIKWVISFLPNLSDMTGELVEAIGAGLRGMLGVYIGMFKSYSVDFAQHLTLGASKIAGKKGGESEKHRDGFPLKARTREKIQEAITAIRIQRPLLRESTKRFKKAVADKAGVSVSTAYNYLRNK